MGIFSTQDVSKLLHNKFVVLIGDSVQRSIYKDLIVLYQGNNFISQGQLRKKGEGSFEGDQLIERSELTNGTKYREVREFKTDTILIRFYFITRSYNEYVEDRVLKDLENEDQPVPDVVVLSSCLWDISRYGDKSLKEYPVKLERLCCRLDEILPPETQIIWRTTLPVSQEIRGGFLTPDVAWRRDMLRLDVLRANYLAYNVVIRHRFDVLDMHYHFRYQQHRRAKDGVHWNMYAHRRMTNILLTHIAEQWGYTVEQPWENNEISISTEEIEANTTTALERAYVHKINNNNNNNMKRIEERYGGPIRSTEEMRRQAQTQFFTIPHMTSHIQSPELYESYYTIPEEEQQYNGNYNENTYNILIPDQRVNWSQVLQYDRPQVMGPMRNSYRSQRLHGGAGYQSHYKNQGSSGTYQGRLRKRYRRERYMPYH